MNEIPLHDLFASRFSKEEMTRRFKKHPHRIPALIEIALASTQPHGWRAAWMLRNVLNKEDPAMVPHLDTLVTALDNRPDGHQRELLHLVEKFTLSDDQEGILFDACVSIWRSIHKSPSVRITALKQLVVLISKYPELVHEVWHLMDAGYGETLSPGIKRIFKRLRNELKPHLEM